MTKKRILGIILLLGLIVSLSLISASFTKGNKTYDIVKTYGPGNTLQGWINISLNNEPTNSLIEDNKGNSISLIKLLGSDFSLTKGVNYNCSVSDCGWDIQLVNPATSKTLSLGESGDSSLKVLAFNLSGEVDSITKVNMSISSNAQEDCDNQLEIVFDDEVRYINTNRAQSTCSEKRNYGCFNLSKTSDRTFSIDGKKFCQKVKLSTSPGFEVGVMINISAGAKKTNISIYNSELNSNLASCNLSNDSTNGLFVDRKCNINFSLEEEGDYYLCISNGISPDPNTIIRGYGDTLNGCGFYTPDGIKTSAFAYEIFAEPKKFGNIGEINVSKISNELKTAFNNYLSTKYNNNCSKGCVIPLEFHSYANQNITINNIDIQYSTNEGSKFENKIYDINYNYSTITTSNKFLKISLDNANFTLPTSFGNISYSLSLDNSNIFSDKIKIEAVPTINYLTPLRAFSQIPIEFSVDVIKVNNASVTGYSWQFGNASAETSTTNKISHTFTSEGTFPVKVSVTDALGKTASKVFYVEVVSYRYYFIERVGIVKERIGKIESQLGNFSAFVQDGIKKAINISDLKQKIAKLELDFPAATSETEYSSIVTQFLEIEAKVPDFIFQRVNTTYLSFYPQESIIEPGAVKEVLGGNFSTSQASAYKKAILEWNVNNINSKIKYTQLTGEYEDGRSIPILNLFELEVTKSAEGTLFIKDLENIKFDGTYGQTFQSGYFSVPLDMSVKRVKFYTTEDIDMWGLPAFVSPSLNQLDVIIEYEEAEKPEMKWTLFILILFFLVLLGIVVYVTLQQWYKYKYETFLFKNRNYLYNLIHYIDSQKKKNVKDSQIFSDLKKQGWTSEQINYVIRKYLGKRTGMLEIPIDKIFRIFGKKSTDIGVPGAPPMGNPNRRPIR